MPDKLEFRLTEPKTLLTLERLRFGMALTLWQPGNTKQGHGWLLEKQYLLSEEQLAQLQAFLSEPQEREAA
jgi:hypothetical protein